MITEICMTDDHLQVLNAGGTVGYVAEGHAIDVDDVFAVYNSAGVPVRFAVVTWTIVTDTETHLGLEAWDEGEIGKAH